MAHKRSFSDNGNSCLNTRMELADHNYYMKFVDAESTHQKIMSTVLMDHNYCTVNVHAKVAGITSESVSTPGATVQSQEQTEAVDMDIIWDEPPRPVFFSPLSAHHRNHICTKLGLSTDMTQSDIHLKYVGVGKQCTGRPLNHVEVQGDGNCLFRALSYLLISSEAEYDILRCKVCDYIADPTNWIKLDSYIQVQGYESGEAYIAGTKMNESATWGTAVELFAFAQLTGKDVVVFTGNRWLPYCSKGTVMQPTKNAFYLDNSSEMHYNPVLGISSTDKGVTNQPLQSIPQKLQTPKKERYMANLRTPEKKRKLHDYRQKDAAKKRKKYNAKKNSKHCAAHGSLSAFTEEAVSCHDIGNMVHRCSACNALMFKEERSDKAASNPTVKFGLCCSYGTIILPPVKEPPETLRSLLTGNTKRDQEFRKNIRAYNSSLAFASMCLTQKEYNFNTKGPYCFRMNGQIYHALSQMQPECGRKPKFSQIYIFDEENQLNSRMQSFQQLDSAVLKELQNMLKEVNPYAHLYKQAGDIMRESPAADIKIVLRAHTKGTNIDPRRYNLPTGTDIAVIIPEDQDTATNRDVIVYKNASSHPNGKSLERITSIHPMYDPLMYVLMFPYGDLGWEAEYQTEQRRYTAMQYYRHRLMTHGLGAYNTIHRMGRLFQQFIVDVYVKIEDGRLQYIRHNQKKIRAELYQGLADAVQNSDGNIDGSQIGTMVVLPSSFTSGARYQHQLYQDAMAIVRQYGKPDLFITFTCNPKWKEITNALLEQQKPEDRQDLVARVFKLKLKSLLEDLLSANVLGKMTALIHVIEWQKRGLPHAHILAICDEESKPRTPDDYDSIVSAEIPDKEQFPELHNTVTTQMMHGPCGYSNPNSPCMIDGKCSKNYPKSFVEKTHAGSNSYPVYMRRNDGKTVSKKGIQLDNRNVVPYNPYLSKRYNAHINVEICNSVQSCKYLYKYVYKGPDMASVAIESTTDERNKKDEVTKYVNSRYITASEACWRIFGFEIHGREPSVQRLAVHQEDMQLVWFKEDTPEDAVACPKTTTLLGWFKLNQIDPDARKLKYHEIPEYFVWNSSQGKWTARKQGRCIGRMYTTNPSQGERHYLRLLLHHIPGAMSFSDLRKTPDGITHETYKETAIHLGLLESDEEWDKCMSEAAISYMPKQLRHLFVTILVFGEPATPEALWLRYKDVMGEDLLHQTTAESLTDAIQHQVDNEVLILLQEELEEIGACLEKFNLPTPNKQRRLQKYPRVIQEETYDVEAQQNISLSMCSSLNNDQQKAFDMIMQAVESEMPNIFFVNAPGGYGKTFLLKALLSTVRSRGRIALAVASSGIAAELLEGGRTAHSRFKIPIPIHENSVCRISQQSNDAKLMKKTLLIIWDEIMMAHVHQIECVDRSLRDILAVDKPFGGITTVFGGDPRQILPVIRHGNQADIVQACVHSSLLWSSVKTVNLTQNMRVSRDEVEFSNYVLTIGDGTVPVTEERGHEMIQVPKKYLVSSLDELIDKVFPNIEDGYPDKQWVARRAILTAKNEGVDKINEVIMSRFPGKGKTYLSADTVGEEDKQMTFPTEFLNTLTPSGLPPHSLQLKVGAPVILLRNLRGGPEGGLRNGTRLIIVSLGDRLLEAEIASGTHKGTHVLLPRILIVPSDTELPFTLKRRQFPIRPCFAMSTNKAQGQTLDFVGIYLPQPVFTHGQLYVAFSRVRNAKSVAVYTDDQDGYTRNIVYKEVL